MRKITPKLLLAVFLLIASNRLIGQQPNPFRSIGKETEVIEISKGKYVEIIEKDSLERVGSVIVNRFTRKIERLLNEDSLNNELINNTYQSRFFSVDPLAMKFPY